jgi:hypothetical protein
MKKTQLFFWSILAVTTLFISACGKEGCTDPDALNYDPDAKSSSGDCKYPDNKQSFSLTRSGNNVTVEGITEADFRFYEDSVYLLKGFVYVRSGAILTIEPGTVIKGDKNTKGSLIIERNSKIIAEGTATKPIVFTSSQAPGDRDYGDWGGLIVCGNAPTNLPGNEGIVEGGTDALFGGNNASDNSGIIKYVRIEFAGIPFQPNQEINGLTLAAVGSETVVEYVQVSYSGDDSYEWFGGNVNASHLISFRGWDDDFDTDNGYSGNLQFLVALRDPNIADASASNGFESDNDPAGSSATPFTSPVFSNVSLYGPNFTGSTSISTQFRTGVHLRRLSNLKLYNSVVTGFPEGLYVAKNTEGNLDNGSVQIENTIIAGCTENFAIDLSSSYDLAAWFNNASRNNSVLANNSDVLLTDAYNLTNPNFQPLPGSPLLSGALFTNSNLSNSFFQQVTYRGAFDGTTDWTQGWANWDPQNTVY